MADEKITALTEDTTPSNDDIIVTVNDPAGTPANRKVTWTNVKAFLKTYFDGIYAALAGNIDQAFGALSIELGHATDTTIQRVSAGLVSIEGKTILTNTSTGGIGNPLNANGTQTITHGLGRVPTIIRIYGIGTKASGSSATNDANSVGIYNSSGNFCIYRVQGASAGQASSNAYAIKVGSGATAFVSGVIQNVTATQFDIVWTESGTSDTTPVYLWEAQ